MALKIDLSTGQRLALDHYGSEDAPALILLHGLSSNRASYDAVVDFLLPRYVDGGQLQLLVVDQRGHGESSRATLDTYDAPSYAADLAALIEYLGPEVGPAVVAGHSLGGVVGAMLAASRPDLVRALFLEDPPLFEADAARRAASPAARFFPALIAAVRQLQERTAPPEDYRPLVDPTSTPDEALGRCHALHQWDPTTMEAAVAGVVWRGYDPGVTLACPVTLVRADPEVGAVFEPGDVEPFCAANPHAEVVMVPGSSHSVHGAPTLAGYLDALNEFLINL